MLQAIKARIQAPAELWCIAGGSLFVVTCIAGGVGLTGTPALVLGALSAALMLIGVAQLGYIEFTTLAR